MTQKMKAKIVVAYEPNSSVTTRITPDDLGKLIAWMKPQQLNDMLDSMIAELNIYKSNKPRYSAALAKAIDSMQIT